MTETNENVTVEATGKATTVARLTQNLRVRFDEEDRFRAVTYHTKLRPHYYFVRLEGWPAGRRFAANTRVWLESAK